VSKFFVIFFTLKIITVLFSGLVEFRLIRSFQ
jgi:hypothetical protein